MNFVYFCITRLKFVLFLHSGINCANFAGLPVFHSILQPDFFNHFTMLFSAIVKLLSSFAYIKMLFHMILVYSSTTISLEKNLWLHLFTFWAFKPVTLTETNGFNNQIFFFFSNGSVLHAKGIIFCYGFEASCAGLFGLLSYINKIVCLNIMIS